MKAIYILCVRQLKRYIRSPARIIGSLGQPILFLVALGFGFKAMFARAGGGDYLDFLSPGIISMAILFNAVFSGIEIIWDRQFGFLKETLVAPVSRIEIVFGRMLGGALVAMAQGIVVFVICLIAGFRIHALALSAAGDRFHVYDFAALRGHRDGFRVRPSGHAGISADHQFSDHADFLFFGRDLSPRPACRRRCRSGCG